MFSGKKLEAVLRLWSQQTGVVQKGLTLGVIIHALPLGNEHTPSAVFVLYGKIQFPGMPGNVFINTQ